MIIVSVCWLKIERVKNDFKALFNRVKISISWNDYISDWMILFLQTYIKMATSQDIAKFVAQKIAKDEVCESVSIF